MPIGDYNQLTIHPDFRNLQSQTGCKSVELHPHIQHYDCLLCNTFLQTFIIYFQILQGKATMYFYFLKSAILKENFRMFHLQENAFHEMYGFKLGRVCKEQIKNFPRIVPRCQYCFQGLFLSVTRLLHTCKHATMLPMRVLSLTLLTVILLSLASHVCSSLVNSIIVCVLFSMA